MPLSNQGPDHAAPVFVITGPSGVGKGTLIAGLRKRIPELELSVSATTRSPRPGETDGSDYHFLDLTEFERRVAANDFLEHAAYSGNRYGTLRSEVRRRVEAGHPVVLEIEVQGARQIRDTMPDAVQVFVAPPALDSLGERLRARGTDSTDAIASRLEVAARELEARGEFNHQVVNDELEPAIDELELIFRRELSK